MTNEQASIELARRIFHEGSSVPNPPEVVASIFAPDFICHGPPGVNHLHAGGNVGPEQCLLQGACQDVSFNLEEVHCEGNRVTCRFIAHGLQVTDFHGVRPSGRTVSISGTTTFRIEEDRVKEAWGVIMLG